MSRREFMKAAMAAVVGVSVAGLGAVACPVVDEVPAKVIYTQPRFKAGEPIKVGVMVYIGADGRAYEAGMKRGLMSMDQFRWTANVKIRAAHSRDMLRYNSHT